MLSAFNRLSCSASRQQSSLNGVSNSINRIIASGYARALQQFSSHVNRSSRSSPNPHFQQRGVVSQAIMRQLKLTPASLAARDAFRFNRLHEAQVDTNRLQQAVIAKLTPGARQPQLSIRHDASVRDVERLVAQHGPVSLSLLGMLPAEQGGGPVPRRHTALVLYTFRDEHADCYAVIVDGNPHARNPVKDAAEEIARRSGKQLHELDPADLANVDRLLVQKSDRSNCNERMQFDQAIHDVINLDRAFETHDATATSYTNFVKRLRKDLDAEGLFDDTIQHVHINTPEVAYAADVRIDGTLPAATARALAARIKSHPEEVKPFVPLQSPVAQADLFEQVPAVRDVFNAPSAAGRWAPPASVEELKNALREEPTFAAALDAPENQPALKKLLSAIADVTMPPNYRGVSLQLQFPVTYGHVAHIAPINLWREKKRDGNVNGGPGKLRMGCLHQEATPISGKVWEGEVHTTFDTSAVHPSGIAPVAESIKFSGLPNVATILPCKYPDKIVPLTRAMAGTENGYPYGGTPSWHGDKGRFAQSRPFNSCSNTSYEAHMICNGKYPTYQSTLPELWTDKIGEIYGVDQHKIQTCTIGSNTYHVKDMLDLPFEIVGAMWPKVTIHSATLPSAVDCTFAPHHAPPVVLKVGKDVRLPASIFPHRFHAARFINPTKDMRLANGTPIKNGITYFADDIQQGIIYSNDKVGKKLDYWLSGVRDDGNRDFG